MGWAASEEVSSPSLAELEGAVDRTASQDAHQSSPSTPPRTCQHSREAGEGWKRCLKGCLGPLPLCSGTLCFWGEAQQGRWDQVDSHSRVEAAAGRVVETPDDGVQHKGHELKKGEERGFRARGRQDEGWAVGRGTRSLAEPAYTCRPSPRPNLLGTLPRKPRQ